MKGIKPWQPHQGRKEDSVTLVLSIVWTKHDALDLMNLDIIKEIFLNLKRTREMKEEAHISEMREEPDAKKSKKEEARDLHYD